MRIAPVTPITPVQNAPRHQCRDLAACPLRARACQAANAATDVWGDPRYNVDSKAAVRATR